MEPGMLQSDHDCPCVTVVGRSLSHADRTPRISAPRIAASSSRITGAAGRLAIVVHDQAGGTDRAWLGGGLRYMIERRAHRYHRFTLQAGLECADDLVEVGCHPGMEV